MAKRLGKAGATTPTAKPAEAPKPAEAEDTTDQALADQADALLAKLSVDTPNEPTQEPPQTAKVEPAQPTKPAAPERLVDRKLNEAQQIEVLKGILSVLRKGGAIVAPDPAPETSKERDYTVVLPPQPERTIRRRLTQWAGNVALGAAVAWVNLRHSDSNNPADHNKKRV